jgi:hypothetical protein
MSRVVGRCNGLVTIIFVFLLSAETDALNKRELYVKGTEFRKNARPSRYFQPWQDVPILKTLSMAEARHRVMYSPLRVLGSDGLGHGMATKNAEITTSIRLGVAYAHRAPKFGSLSYTNAHAMEAFFGWGRGELSGKQFHEENCKPTPSPVSPIRHEIGVRDCNVCRAIKQSSPYRMKRVVEVPEDISFRSLHIAKPQVDRLIAMHNESHTVFQMAQNRCGTYPILVDFSVSRPWFYHKYWAQHAIGHEDIKAQSLALYGLPNVDSVEEESPTSAALVDNPIMFNDHEISIAVHVRRGDFFKAKNRKMIVDLTYVNIIRTVQDVIEEGGGLFASMPVAVYIYSEGRPKDGQTFLTHVRTALTNEYLDATGTVRDANWWQMLLQHATPQSAGRPGERQGKNPKIPRVELRISRPTIESLHQMIHGKCKASGSTKTCKICTASLTMTCFLPGLSSSHCVYKADVFIGSMSGLSTYTVRSLSRAVQIYPGLSDYHTHAFCCSVNAHETTGVFDRNAFVHQWNSYRLANEKYLVATKQRMHAAQTTGSVFNDASLAPAVGGQKGQVQTNHA